MLAMCAVHLVTFEGVDRWWSSL